jgi:hypothetical protein
LKPEARAEGIRLGYLWSLSFKAGSVATAEDAFSTFDVSNLE